MIERRTHGRPPTALNLAISAAARARAIKHSIAATEARKRAEHRVDWDAVIERLKADMRERYGDDEICDRCGRVETCMCNEPRHDL